MPAAHGRRVVVGWVMGSVAGLGALGQHGPGHLGGRRAAEPLADPAGGVDKRVQRDAGFDAERAQAILASDDYAAEVREAERFFTRNGINGVPAVIIERKHLVSGGQPVEVFERALREIAAGLPG